jgi:rubrerythrin
MLPANLKPIEIFDLGIFNEAMTYTTYERISRRVDLATLQARLALLKKDEKDHRKTLKAHRKSLFGSAACSATEDEAAKIFGRVDTGSIRDKDSLLRILHEAVKAEEYGAYFYDRMRNRIPDREARIFLEVLSSEGAFHAGILRQQIALLRNVEITVDDHGRPVEVV